MFSQCAATYFSKKYPQHFNGDDSTEDEQQILVCISGILTIVDGQKSNSERIKLESILKRMDDILRVNRNLSGITDENLIILYDNLQRIKNRHRVGLKIDAIGLLVLIVIACVIAVLTFTTAIGFVPLLIGLAVCAVQLIAMRPTKISLDVIDNKLNKIKPLTYHLSDIPSRLEPTPDGVGLQILFEDDKDYYLIAGTRLREKGDLITVNGGKIDNENKPYFDQIEKEFKEETFGVMQIIKKEDGYYLKLAEAKGGSTEHKLSLSRAGTVIDHKPGKYTYVTFTAVCSTVSLQQLKETAKLISPVAKFWNVLGSYLYQCSHQAKNNFPPLELRESKRNELIRQLTDLYEQMPQESQALITSDLQSVFQTKNIRGIFNKIISYDTLKKLSSVVGSYSERPGYYVLKADDVQRPVDNYGGGQSNDFPLTDVDNNEVASNRIFNWRAVKHGFPAILKPSVQVSRMVPRF